MKNKQELYHNYILRMYQTDANTAISGTFLQEQKPNNVIVSYSNTSKFEVESLDPDKRSWYYDGSGMMRKKE
jgi:hypothetical protein